MMMKKIIDGVVSDMMESEILDLHDSLPTALEPEATDITKRQLRLTLVRNGVSLESVEAAIAAIPDGLAKQEAQIEWSDANTFNRSHPTLLLIAGALGLTEAQIDAMWEEAATA